MVYHLYIRRDSRSVLTWEEIAIVEATCRDEAIVILEGWDRLDTFYKSGHWMIRSDRQLQPDNAVRMNQQLISAQE